MVDLPDYFLSNELWRSTLVAVILCLPITSTLLGMAGFGYGIAQVVWSKTPTTGNYGRPSKKPSIRAKHHNEDYDDDDQDYDDEDYDDEDYDEDYAGKNYVDKDYDNEQEAGEQEGGEKHRSETPLRPPRRGVSRQRKASSRRASR
ncbi:hypothetical protein H2200_004248 [Cladophialophora chaetospira]|uniref:Uncharacterized protein n=1 Tax=Cladophialophora chaetospira TaxID=386627 RepID=A0AA38XCY7_9EURO|nr:hypothetical protein H2200_004248 [Cladophialophora chaetospira]